MGVALIISRCGSSGPEPGGTPGPASAAALAASSASFLRSASRCATPKRCCSSMMASPSRWKRTLSSITACVPTISVASPEAAASSIFCRALPLTLPVIHATRMPSGSSQPISLRKCCSARISVGAISAHCQPASMATAAASAATTVLPEPTSPCSSRCIGWGRARSAAISSATRRCAPVSAKGRAASSRSCSPPGAPRSTGARRWARSRWARCWLSCCASSSSNLSRCQAGWVWSSSVDRPADGGGWCRKFSASRSGGRPRGISACGSTSSSGARRSAEATALRR